MLEAFTWVICILIAALFYQAIAHRSLFYLGLGIVCAGVPLVSLWLLSYSEPAWPRAYDAYAKRWAVSLLVGFVLGYASNPFREKDDNWKWL
jgi:hypothetical protein